MFIATIIRDVPSCSVQWDRGAVLQRLINSTTRDLLNSEQLYDGTVAGAVRYFKSLPVEHQERIEMFVDSGVLSALEEDTIIGAEALRALASRSDLPET